MRKRELRQPKNYKGAIRYFKTQKGGDYFIVKSRPFRDESYQIHLNDYEWCDTYTKASKLWHCHHMVGTALYYGDKVKHPRTGIVYSDIKKIKDKACEQNECSSFHFYDKKKICQNCKKEFELAK